MSPLYAPGFSEKEKEEIEKRTEARHKAVFMLPDVFRRGILHRFVSRLKGWFK